MAELLTEEGAMDQAFTSLSLLFLSLETVRDLSGDFGAM